MTDDDFARLERKVDKLTDAVSKLILFEERQMNQGERIGRCESGLAVAEASIAKVDRKVDMWVNRGIGVWLAAGVVFTLIQFGFKFMSR
jgi:hypothetical protein